VDPNKPHDVSTDPADQNVARNRLDDVIDYVLQRRNAQRRYLYLKLAAFGFALALGATAAIFAIVHDSSGRPNKIAVVSIKGVIGAAPTATADGVNRALTAAYGTSNVKAVVLRIDSPGGSPTEANRITTQLSLLRKKRPDLRVDAVFEGTGASAAYLIAMGADRVFADPYSLVGSVGAVMQTWNYGEAARAYRLDQSTYKSGALKDMGNPMRPANAQDNAKAQELINDLASIFGATVQLKRGAKLKLTTAQLMTGEVWTGQTAAANGLVDGVATVESLAVEYDATIRDFSRIPINVPGFGQMRSDVSESLIQRVADAIAQALNDTLTNRIGAPPSLRPF